MMPYRRFRRFRHGRHSPWHGHHHHGGAFDLQHFLFRWLVGAVLATTFLAAHFGFFSRDAGLRPSGFWLVLAVSMFVFWFASGRVARRLSRPMAELTDFARAIGQGQYEGRTRLSEHRLREVRIMARTLNDMAARVQRQLTDQQELLAAVSHELRSPLSRMRVLLELARENSGDTKNLDAIEEEVIACDRLIGMMLASSRLEFSSLDLRLLDGDVLARRALQRAGLPEALLVCGTEDLSL